MASGHAESFPQNLVGKTEAEAVSEIKSRGMRARVRRRDKKGYPGTMEVRTDRVNLELDDGKVTYARVG